MPQTGRAPHRKPRRFFGVYLSAWIGQNRSAFLSSPQAATTQIQPIRLSFAATQTTKSQSHCCSARAGRGGSSRMRNQFVQRAQFHFKMDSSICSLLQAILPVYTYRFSIFAIARSSKRQAHHFHTFSQCFVFWHNCTPADSYFLRNYIATCVFYLE